MYHDTQLPNKQNLYCNGQSTWEVILQSPDFIDDNNPPDPTIMNTDPEFIIVGGEGESSSLPYVLVVDISLSMVQKARFIPMKNAAKRWIAYDLQDDVNLGLVFFNHLTIDGFNMTTVTADSRIKMSQVIDDVEASGRTCITCGLLTAAQRDNFLNKHPGVIILLTDGKQTESVPDFEYTIGELIKQKVRVITIALGDEADPKIEDLAEKTGGKSFYVDDNSGPGDFNDAFSGSTTFQPGDTLGDTDVTIYQKDWKKENDTKFKDVFDVDSSLGRNLSFRLEFVKSKSEVLDCGQDLDISFQDADGKLTQDKFKCSKDNFGIYTKVFDGSAASGRWLYVIDTVEVFESMSVKITSKSSDGTTDPIMTKCWINTGSQVLGGEVLLKLSAMAEVKQGNMPVIGAKVKAYIERPQESGPALELELFDNGSGADSIQNDGIYTRYFTKYTGTGRYSVKCEVSGGDGTQINEGFIVDRSIPEKPIPTPMCCGSNALRPDSKLTKTGNFSRQSAGGSFQATDDVPSGDMYPPSRVLDLKVPNPTGSLELEFTSPGDDLDSKEPVTSYTIRYALRANNLTDNFNSSENLKIDDTYLISGSLSPVNGGSLVSLKLDTNRFESGNLYFFAMTAIDEKGNISPVSNVVSFCLKCEASSGVPTAAPTASPTSASTAAPTTAPTPAPTTDPTAAPTTALTAAPTTAPTAAPTTAPTAAPTTATQTNSTTPSSSPIQTNSSALLSFLVIMVFMNQ